ncbi:MAG: shikimate kinase [archaeon]|nr:shikimate kinase [archaeon]
MTGRGISHGCISVLNGIVSGTGAVIGTAMVTEAEYEETGTEQKVTIIGAEQPDDNLARICVRRALETAGKDTSVGYILVIRSDIPPSRGLKSSSSVCNAILHAVFDHHGFKIDDMELVLLGVECAKEGKVTVTGSFDDACGCEFGGYIVTNNYENKVLKQTTFGKYDVVLCTPEYTKRKVPRAEYEAVAPEMEEIKAIAETDVLKALTLNGKLIARVTGEDTGIIDKALGLGALAAGISGTGPAVAVVTESGKGKELAEKLPCNTLVTETR